MSQPEAPDFKRELPVRRIPMGVQIVEMQRTLNRAIERLESEFDLRNETCRSTLKLANDCRVKLGMLRIMLDVVFNEDDTSEKMSHEEMP